ncbi:phage tail fiber protein [Pectobacterium aroidearum]|uniref:phage tail fiber protein n=1 Tax=Pectobacterium aroidearum TaxID=1201031 RepID=UPI00301933F8
MSNTITSADSIFALTVTNLFPSAQTLQGYAADAMFALGDTEMAVSVRGADGKLSAGFVFGEYLQTITIMPDSPSRELFETWQLTSLTSKAVFRCNATIILPGISRKFTLTNGVLQRVKAMPDANRVLQAMTYQINWQDVIGESYQA